MLVRGSLGDALLSPAVPRAISPAIFTAVGTMASSPSGRKALTLATLRNLLPSHAKAAAWRAVRRPAGACCAFV